MHRGTRKMASNLGPKAKAILTSALFTRSSTCMLCNSQMFHCRMKNLSSNSKLLRFRNGQINSPLASFVGARGNCSDSGSSVARNSGGGEQEKPLVQSESATGAASSAKLNRLHNIRNGPSLKDFVANTLDSKAEVDVSLEDDCIPYLPNELDAEEASSKKVYFETYGCQMNVSDTEIAWAILEKSGFQKVEEVSEADVILAVTCAIRENAEQKIWNRLKFFQSLKNNRRKGDTPLKIGLLGCMAERLKKKLLEQSKTVDLVAGPDAYRDLPRLLSVTESGQSAINVMLSMDETYADVIPVRLDKESKSAFVSIMRGCDNMCSYCIVPFTRGRERSRPIGSIVQEIQALADQGVKEVTLLGQNVNSYRDVSESSYYGGGVGTDSEDNLADAIADDDRPTRLARGFKSIYRPKKGGRRFADLLERVALVDPEMRIRFTSPHPKDFPDEVLHAIRDFPNICNQLHLPAQSGSTQVLDYMRRGYSREAYLELVDHVQSMIPGVALSSDFIAGFCGESEADHEDTMSLLRMVKYNYAFLFAYSMRQKTRAYHRMEDDVPEEVKQRRLREMITVCRDGMAEINATQIGNTQLVLIEGVSKRSTKDLVGRNDANTKVIIPNIAVLDSSTSQDLGRSGLGPGDYVAVEITESNSQVLKGRPLYHSTLQGFASGDAHHISSWQSQEETSQETSV